MMAAVRIPTDPDPVLEREIADLWANGFDTADITVALVVAGYLNDRAQPVTEADVCRVLRDQRDQRRPVLTRRARA